jgi:hemerythrin superfamily protein
MLLAQLHCENKKEFAMPDAIQMLRDDHRKVQQLFEDFQNADDAATQLQIARVAIADLELHATLEEEIFYPAAVEQVDDADMINEAREEHHVVRFVANELKKMRGSEERFKAKFTVMAESVRHHIEEEEGELFPQLEVKLDAEEIGQRMEQRRQKLQSRSSRSSATTRSPKRRSSSTKGTARRGKKGKKRAAGSRR